MMSRPELRKVLHNVRSKCASLGEAAELPRDCPEDRARKMVGLMAQEARDLVRSLGELEAALSGEKRPQ